jgi:hypothetical protein
MEKPVQEQPADQPMQKNLKGHPIPLPKRSEIMDAFKKIAKGKKP